MGFRGGVTPIGRESANQVPIDASEPIIVMKYRLLIAVTKLCASRPATSGCNFIGGLLGWSSTARDPNPYYRQDANFTVSEAVLWMVGELGRTTRTSR